LAGMVRSGIFVTDQVHSKDPSPVARVIVSGLAMAERS
jgi:hypothetical protein